MTEKKAKPVTKNATKAKAGSVVTSKPTVTKKAAAPTGEKAPKEKSPEPKPTISKTKPSSAAKPAVKPTPEERYRMVETAAYFIAEQHGFQGRSDEPWVAAERQIAARLGQ